MKQRKIEDQPALTSKKTAIDEKDEECSENAQEKSISSMRVLRSFNYYSSIIVMLYIQAKRDAPLILLLPVLLPLVV